jgi:hypothetical protein
MRIQYLGYVLKSNAHAYSFRVVDSLTKERKFTVTVPNQPLTDTHFRWQNIPDLCFCKLKEGLSFETQACPLPLQLTVSGAELQKYVEEHYPAKRKPS